MMQPKIARETGAVVRATEDVVGKKVVNLAGEDVGEIKEIVFGRTGGARDLCHLVVRWIPRHGRQTIRRSVGKPQL